MRDTLAISALAKEWHLKLIDFDTISPIFLMRKSRLNFEKCVKIVSKIKELRTDL